MPPMPVVAAEADTTPLASAPPPWLYRSEAFAEDLIDAAASGAGALPPDTVRVLQNPIFSVNRSVRGSAGWTWRSATGATSPGSRDS